MGKVTHLPKECSYKVLNLSAYLEGLATPIEGDRLANERIERGFVNVFALRAR
jgi:hypothetical protein